MCFTYICWTTGIWVSFISRWREKKVHSMNSGNEAEIHENACLITSHMGWGCRTEGTWQYSYQKIHNSKSLQHAWTATILARKWLLCCCHELYGFTNLAYYFNRYIVDVGNYTVLAANSHRQHQDFWQLQFLSVIAMKTSLTFFDLLPPAGATFRARHLIIKN